MWLQAAPASKDSIDVESPRSEAVLGPEMLLLFNARSARLLIEPVIRQRHMTANQRIVHQIDEVPRRNVGEPSEAISILNPASRYPARAVTVIVLPGPAVQKLVYAHGTLSANREGGGGCCASSPHAAPRYHAARPLSGAGPRTLRFS